MTDRVQSSAEGLAYDFPLAGATSGRALIDFLEAGEDAELQAAIVEEARAFAAAAPARIDRGLVTADEAKANAALIDAIALDLQTRAARADQWRLWLSGHRLDQPPPLDDMLAAAPNPKPWADKVALLRALLEARRKSLPDDVAKGRTTEDQARAALECLDALHQLYWCGGFAWDGTDDQLRAHSNKLWEAALSGKADAA